MPETPLLRNGSARGRNAGTLKLPLICFVSLQFPIIRLNLHVANFARLMPWIACRFGLSGLR